ncbi:hypothetical protein A4R26_23940 [Niastella populi]|uniref:Uncharacterized protein n=1 Tax=Niastella populi TaxID=550983 RepID=A0A1V9FGX1_9BACT|nr:hypothetical protein A4R26_23940 [Niastella populi]
MSVYKQPVVLTFMHRCHKSIDGIFYQQFSNTPFGITLNSPTFFYTIAGDFLKAFKDAGKPIPVLLRKLTLFSCRNFFDS